MEHGLAVLDIAKLMAEERRDETRGHRAVSELKESPRGATRLRHQKKSGSETPRWRVEWVVNGFTGKRVTLVNSVTGERRTSRHHSDWQTAFGEALRQARLSI